MRRIELSNFFSIIFFISFIGTIVYLVRFLIYRKKDKKSSKTAQEKKYAIIFAIAMIVGFLGYGSTAKDDEVKNSSSQSSSTKSSSSEKSGEKSSEKSSSSDYSSSQSSNSSSEDSNPDSYKTGITYDQIARTPDQFKGQKLSFTGKVVQVTEDGDTELRVAVDGNSDNIIYVFVDKDLIKKSRVLEDDLITVSGKSKGTISYDSTGSGKITIPAINAKIINDQGKASDDYGE